MREMDVDCKLVEDQLFHSIRSNTFVNGIKEPIIKNALLSRYDSKELFLIKLT